MYVLQCSHQEDDMSNDPTVKGCTAKRKVAMVMNIFKGKTTVADVARQR